MAKVSSRYDSRFVEYLKSIGGKWDPQSKTWTVPESRVDEVLAKAKELNVQDFKIQREPSSRTGAQPQASSQSAEGTIRMRLSRDGRFVLISVNLIAFADDVKKMLDGKRRTVRFRILPPRQQ